MRMTLLAGHHQGGEVLLVLGVYFNLGLEQELDGLGVARAGRKHQGGASLFVLGISIGSRFQ